MELIHFTTRPISRSSEPAFAVVPIKGKGMGCVALRAISVGERILTDFPLVLLKEGMKEHDLADQIAALSSADRTRLFSLSQNELRFGSTLSAAGITATNGIPFRHRGARHGGVFPLASRFNHSCDANALYKWNPASGALTVHATRDIDVGAEIHFNYGFDSIFATRAERQQWLLPTFGFACTCDKCSLTGAALQASDARNAALSDSNLLAELEACGRIDVLLSTDAATALGQLEERYAQMHAESPGVLHGVENFLQVWVEWCESASRRLAEQPATMEVAEKAAAYMDAAWRWAQRARDVTGLIAGEDAPSYHIWVDALARGCWQSGAASPPGPDFERLWIDGLAAPPLDVALASLHQCVAEYADSGAPQPRV